MSATGLEEEENVESSAGGYGRGGQGDRGGQDGGDTGRLIEFLQDLDADLLDMINDPDFMPKDLRDSAASAYTAGGAPGIELMISMLRSPSQETIRGLEHHGLTGGQLDFKMRIHGLSRDRYLLFRPPLELDLDVTLGDPLGRPGTEPWADIAARDYLSCSDIILESLSGALGGAGATVIEIKKMIEWLKGAGWGWARRIFGIR